MPKRQRTTTPKAGASSTSERRLGANVRADAQRNRTAIVRATVESLGNNSDASVADIAAAAGVGRMTLYGHFKTRAELVEAALLDALDRGDEVLSRLELGGDPRKAFAALIESSWMLVDQSRALLTAAQKELPPTRIRELHQKAEAHVRGLLERGQREGAFRTDLPVSWLLATTHVVMHGAADEIAVGRLNPEEAPRYIRATLLAAFAPADGPDRGSVTP
ncbi:TetR/AcrR family transcriptional regulator [Actinopolymorpha pittospori]|uniref:AcrR family transcriptional regulator n=1 Tax=Actinopolymorpha pittospori TaxID=648752 RepID=A0A927MTC2_9ACTN|nr:TetR family transcriptional regulator [Actinopolymorpha pittospori]MBE1605804.1 AcrR family transcriptional regulator [Actinopolymorpha pittospori]